MNKVEPHQRQSLSYLSKEEGVGWSCEIRDGYGVGLWKSIRKEWNIFVCSSSFVVGNGRRVKFWKDKWCGDEPLCVSFLSLYALTVSKETWERGHWNPCFSRPLNDWEVVEVEDLFSRLQGKVCGGRQDGVDELEQQ